MGIKLVIKGQLLLETKLNVFRKFDSFVGLVLLIIFRIFKCNISLIVNRQTRNILVKLVTKEHKL